MKQPLEGMATSRWSLCARPGPQRAGHHPWPAMTDGGTPSSLHKHLTSVEFPSCQEESINHPAAVSAEKSGVWRKVSLSMGRTLEGAPSLVSWVGGAGALGGPAGGCWLQSR